MNSKYVYKLDYYIKEEKTEQFENCLEKIVETHKKHKNGLGDKMEVYRTFIGEEDVVTLMVSMENMAEMDLWIHTPDLVLDLFGMEEGMRILQDYEASLGRTKSSIIEEYSI
ncbi:MAG: hypothetical protein E7214_14080 [Clostridium sp.]|nr:hypothetical protein [Clostridium sp.]